MKISIIGAGNVGSTAAFELISLLDLDELALIDVNEKLARGQALDLGHAASALGKKVSIKSGLAPLMDGSDLIINCAGIPRKEDQSRLDLIKTNLVLTANIVEDIKKYAGSPLVMQVANPLDVLTYFVWKKTGFPRDRVFGMGSMLDTARYHFYGGRGMVVAEHGDDMVFLHPEPKAMEETRNAGKTVIGLKGHTAIAPAASIYRMANAVVNDTNEVLPVCMIFGGEFGIRDVAMGAPARLGADGATIVESEVPKDKVPDLTRVAQKISGILREAGL